MKMMQPLITHQNLSARPEIIRDRQIYGFFYGIAVALAFAFWTWGLDAYQLSKANALEPWIKLIIGLIVCLPAGGIAGWLSMRFEKVLVAVLIWLVAAGIFAWMSVSLPFLYGPQWTIAAHGVPVQIPEGIYDSLFTRLGVAYAWVAIIVLIAGVLELPMGESAVFSTSLFGKLAPSLVCAALMGISGFMVDGLSNQPLRDPILLTNDTLRFAVDHQGQHIDPAISRAMHLAGLRTINDVITQPRLLTIGEYDRELGEIHVLVKFGDQWVDCLTLYNQLSNCQKITP
jgi:hypothetical protein